MIVFKCNYKIVIYYVIIIQMVINTIHTVIYNMHAIQAAYYIM